MRNTVIFLFAYPVLGSITSRFGSTSVIILLPTNGWITGLFRLFVTPHPLFKQITIKRQYKWGFNQEKVLSNYF